MIELKTKFLKISFLLSFLSILSFQSLGATYYSANSTDLSSVNNWWTNTNATGSHPSNFTTGGDVFTIQAGHSCTSSANTAFTNTTLTINGTFTPGAAIVISGNILNGSGIVNITRTTNENDNLKGQYSFSTRTLDALTINYTGSAQQYFDYPTWVGKIYKLKIDNNVRLTAEGYSQVSYLEVVSGKTFELQSFHIEASYGITNNGTVTGSATDAIYTDHGSGAYLIEGNGIYPYVKLGTNTGPYTITGNNTFSTLDLYSGNLTLNCGTITTLTNMIVRSGLVVNGTSGPGEWARIVNANAVSNSGTIGSASTHLAFSGTISGGTIVNDGTNVLQNSSQSATCISLPIQLFSFTAKKSREDVLLNWTTVTEINNDYFSIERSFDAIHFNDIVNVKGAENSINQINYSYTDTQVPREILYYRLKQVDFDGQFEYSAIISVNSKRENEVFAYIYPNPCKNGNVNLTYNAEDIREINISVFDISGNLMINQIKPVSNGRNILNLDFSILQAGIYLVKIGDLKNIIHLKLIVEN